MKVKLTVPISGANGAFNIGDEYPCSKDEAERFIKAGMATAIPQKAERAVKKTAKKETR